MSFDLGAQSQSPVAGILVKVRDATTNQEISRQSFSFSTSSLQSVWQRQTIDFTATSSSSVIQFIGNYRGGVSTGLDNTSVTVVPSPEASSIFFGGLILGYLTVSRRRKHSEF
ncbi:MAG: hypothetical protein H7308_08065 [Chthonomonadaceae bacterium]|nr:hypothetical protein [Chthonomonadaceae bacterium]